MPDAIFHISFKDVVDHTESEVLEDQLAFFLGALGYQGNIRSDVTWNDTCFPLDAESEDPVNAGVLDSAIALLVESAERLLESSQNEQSTLLNDLEVLRTLEGEERARFLRSLRDKWEDLDADEEDEDRRDIGDYIREQEEDDGYTWGFSY